MTRVAKGEVDLDVDFDGRSLNRGIVKAVDDATDGLDKPGKKGGENFAKGFDKSYRKRVSANLARGLDKSFGSFRDSGESAGDSLGLGIAGGVKDRLKGRRSGIQTAMDNMLKGIQTDREARGLGDRVSNIIETTIANAFDTMDFGSKVSGNAKKASGTRVYPPRDPDDRVREVANSDHKKFIQRRGALLASAKRMDDAFEKKRQEGIQREGRMLDQALKEDEDRTQRWGRMKDAAARLNDAFDKKRADSVQREGRLLDAAYRDDEARERRRQVMLERAYKMNAQYNSGKLDGTGQRKDPGADFGMQVGKMFGKGSRNNALNLIGGTVENLVGLFGKMGLTGTSMLSKIAAGGIAVTISLSALVSVLGAVLGLLTAITSTIVTALVGGAVILAATFAAAATGAGLLAAAFMSLDDDQFANMKKTFAPLKDTMAGIGQLMVKDMIPAFDKWASNLQRSMMLIIPTAKVMGEAFARSGKIVTRSLSGEGFQKFAGAMEKFLPKITVNFSKALGSFLNGMMGSFAALTPSVLRLSDYLAKVAERFSKWATSAKGQNAIANFAKSAEKSIKSLWGFVREFSGYLSDVLFSSQAQKAGNGMFDSLTKSFENFRKNLSGDGLKKWFDDALQFGSAAKQAFIGLSNVIAALYDSGVLSMVGEVFKTIGSALQTAAPAVKLFTSALGALPPIVANIAVAALVFPRLAAGLTAMKGSMDTAIVSARVLKLEMSTMSGVATKAKAMMTAVGGAARTAAGVGGMVALQKGAEKSGTAMGDLLTIGGAAATGFGVAGPWGAAIAGAGAGLYTIYKRATSAADGTKVLAKSTDSLKASSANVTTLANSYDLVSGAVTKSTRSVLANYLLVDEQGKKSGDIMKAAGIEAQTAISAMMGDPAAVSQVNRVFQSMADSVEPYKAAVVEAELAMKQFKEEQGRASVNGAGRDAAADNAKWTELRNKIKAAEAALKDQKTEVSNTRNAWASLNGYGEVSRKQFNDLRFAALNLNKDLTKAFPTKERRSAIVAEVREEGTVPTAEKINSMIQKFDMTKPEIKAFVKTVGVDASEAQIRELMRTGEFLTKKELKLRAVVDAPDASAFRPFEDAIHGFERRKFKAPDMKTPTKKGATDAAKTAKSGGATVGTEFGAGMRGGILGATAVVANQAAAMVRTAIAAARIAALISSPSKKTEEIGKFMGEGLSVGLGKQDKNAKAAGKRLANSAIKGAADTMARMALDAPITKAGAETRANTAKSRGGTKEDPVSGNRGSKAGKSGGGSSGNGSGKNNWKNPWKKMAERILKQAPSAAELMSIAIRDLNRKVALSIIEASKSQDGDAVSSAMAAGSEQFRDFATDAVAQARDNVYSAADTLASATTKAAGRKAKRALDRALKERKHALAEQVKLNNAAKKMAAQQIVTPKHVAALLNVKNHGIVANATLADYATAREQLVKRIEDAEDALADAIAVRDDYKNAVADSIRSFGSLLTAQVKAIDGVDQALTHTDITENLEDRLAKIRKFRDNLKTLLSLGLGKTAYEQLVDAGVEGGSAYAEALVQGGVGAVSGVNDMTAAIGVEADALGLESSNRLHQAGVDSAAGFLAGLKTLDKELQAAATAFAKKFADAIKKELGIKSPSTVMIGLMGDVGDGAVIGLNAQHNKVGLAATNLADTISRRSSATIDGGTPGSGSAVSGNQTVHNWNITTPTENPAAVAQEMINEMTGRL